ncbi:MAG: dehydrodolichyl diphosphate synthase [Piptocephalis tieghemiana]|nr:MAG: dehydrodolichyl diphosphate synthase [Piptocephalis tieghemiana]
MSSPGHQALPAPSLLQRCLRRVNKEGIHWTLRILRQGPIPKHLGFIMDGNRRFARKHHVETGIGHYRGFDKLEEVLEWCLLLGVQAVTIYAFSIENFKRSSSEVSSLMDLAKEKLQVLCQHSELVREYRVRIRVLGDLSLLQQDVREAMQEAMRMTLHHDGPLLNICFPYTAREDMTQAVNRVVNQVRAGHLREGSITEDTIEAHLHTQPQDLPLDLLLRTSGEIRLSDFLLWQASLPGCQIHFSSVLWPELGLWHLLPALLSYQSQYPRLCVRQSLSSTARASPPLPSLPFIPFYRESVKH